MIVQNQLLREHATGNYAELLAAIVKDPAMLRYLDNNSNRKSHPNENLAREVMELFSLGAGNYTEDDVEHAAERSGFGSADTMRRAFLRSLGVGPAEYRSRFHSSRPSAESLEFATGTLLVKNFACAAA